MDERGNTPTDPEWVKTLKPGWQRHRNDNFNADSSGIQLEEDQVGDKWTDPVRISRLSPGKTRLRMSPEEKAVGGDR